MNDFEKYIIDKNADIKEALVRLDKLSSDVLTLFVLEGKKVIGSITDGDIRRALIHDAFLETSVEKIMNRNFRYIHLNEKNVDKIRAIRSCGIQLVPCLNEQGELINVYNLKILKSILPFDAVLMAGGKGERLRPLTEKTPKPLLPLGEKLIIDHNIDNLIAHGISDIYVTTNYLAEQVESHFSKKKENVNIKCIRENEFYGTIASVKLISSLTHDEVLIMNSDLFTNIDFEDFYRHFIENKADMSAVAIPYSINIPYGIFGLNENIITGIEEKPTYNYYANAGIYLVKKHLLDEIPDKTYFDAPDLMNLLISKGKKIVRYPLVGYWIDIGRPEEYKKAQEFARHIKNSR
ncbi:MAG: nucleotidyltransferase family protein [Massilibacteroides sp.]|nr:nucleotidyltransferase family protein [Massilibacteroides sp.]MDD3062268.1 nucleotidyltransferase family protein [Massilibacteroides sp.]MDD4113993.1 nucleotidyltransferase family protein [Massilibacteroides sp.]MDD4660041.1 nucleotidyltransferase family protein [Massilibacteroides sp.]